ncbi:ABC transporter substrate-binding protein [Microbacterium jejuense]|uniref:ABC transporter substrate-binding protein n=1 Tax=Microbacterium jejuense TaxID=1263637 RepID=UPI0031E5D7AC
MKSRYIAAVAGVAIAAVSLSACSSSSDENSGETPEASKTLTIGTTSNNQVPMEAVVAAYKEKTGLDVNVTLADTGQYQTTIRTQLSSGTAPDVFTVWAGSGNPAAIQILQGAGYLADLSDRPWVDEVDPGTAEQLQIDGKTYGLPSKLDAIGAIYNKTTLDGLGLDIPTTYDELLDFCGDVKDAGKVAFALGIQTDWVTQLIPYALTSSLVYGPDPDFGEQLADGSTTFADSNWKSVLDKYLEMNDAGCFQPDPLGTDVNASYDLVNKGDALAVVQVVASYAQIASTAPAGTEYGFFQLPGDDSAEVPLPRGIGVSFAVNAEAQNEQNALDFVDWLATPEATSVWFDAAPGIPALTTTDVTLEGVPLEASDAIAAGLGRPFPDSEWPSAKPQAALFTGVQQLFSGQATVEDVLNSMDEAYQG